MAKTHERINRDALSNQFDIVEVVSRYVDLTSEGTEFVACCPFHDETSPSFKVSPAKQFAHCFGCGYHGDVLGFVGDIEGCGKDLPRIRDILLGKKSGAVELPAPSRTPIPRQQQKDDWQVMTPVPEYATEPSFKLSSQIRGEWHDFELSMAHAYRDADGNLLGYVARHHHPIRKKQDGTPKKETRPRTWCRNTLSGKEDWRWKGFDEPRPMYGIDSIAARADQPILITEGEKCQEAGVRLAPSIASASWPGGGKGISKVDWSPVKGRNIILWRDNDPQCYDAFYGVIDDNGELTRGLVHYLQEAGARSIRIVEPPENMPKGWDIADAEAEGWTSECFIAYIRSHAGKEIPPPRSPADEIDPGSVLLSPEDAYYQDLMNNSAEEEEPQFIHDVPPEPESEAVGEFEDVPPVSASPYRPLGYDHSVYFYLSYESGQIHSLPASSHTKLHMLSIAEESWWQSSYPGKGGPSWDMAANAMMRESHACGPYNPDMIRGRGAWWDTNRAVLHLGSHLVVDGVRHELKHTEGRYIYEAARAIHIKLDTSLNPTDASQLLDICKLVQFEDPFSAYLLAGWLAAAPICGAMYWRPHIWITGGAGTGKSWTMHNIVSRVTGDFSLKPVGNTTEAGLRQTLGHDAMPVVFDEAEGEDERARDRMQGVLQLARQASSDGDGQIIKGSAGGQAQSFRTRSMFAFASIGVSTTQYADKTRISVLSLARDPKKTKEDSREQFERLERYVTEVLTDEYIERLHARSIRLISVIRANARVFSRAAAKLLGEQRLGDQVGAMLAGAFSLTSNQVVSEEFACQWLSDKHIQPDTELADQRDEYRCLSRIMESAIRVQGPQGVVDRNIGQLVEVLAEQRDDTQVSKPMAVESLKANGILTDFDEVGIQGAITQVIIANNHSNLDAILKNSPWGSNWGTILKRLPGSKATEKGLRYGAGSLSRGTIVSVDLMIK